MSRRGRAAAVLALAACWAAHAQELANPAPAMALNGFGKYELKPLATNSETAKDVNAKAAVKVQENMAAQLAPLLATWNADGAAGGKASTLVIEPTVYELHYSSGGKRFLAGAWAGESNVVIRVKLTEMPGGKVIGEPEFYQRTSRQAGAWTMGAQDNNMLNRVVTLIHGYLTANYQEATGGPTGRPAN